MVLLDTKRTNQALLDTVARLVDELIDVPPGRVLRCFSRAVGYLRRVGCPTDQLPAEAEWLARELLADRLVLEAIGAPTLVTGRDGGGRKASDLVSTSPRGELE